MENLQQGSKGESVAKLQTALQNAGFSPGVIDSDFGPKTAQALRDYQTSKGLTVDAIAGPETYKSLYGTGSAAPITSSQGKSPLELAKALPIPTYGSDVKDATGNVVGKATFDPNTGKPLPNPSTVNNPNNVVGTSEAARQIEIQKIKDQLNSGTTEPTPYKSLDEFNKLRTEKGVVQDENELASIREEANQIKETLRQASTTAGEGTSEAGRIGAVSEAERNAQFRLDSLALRESAVTDRLNTKNSYINTALQLGKDDYQTAYTNYTNEYNKNLKAVDLYNSNLDDAKKDALTGFTTISNLLKDKNITTLDPSISTQLDTLALKAGLPSGIFQSVMATAGDEKILSPMIVDTDTGKNVYFFTQSADGTPNLKEVKTLAGSSGGGKTLSLSQNVANFSSLLKTGKDGKGTVFGNPRGSDGFVDPDVYITAFKNWPGTTAQFLSAFPVEKNVNPASYNLLPTALKPKTTGDNAIDPTTGLPNWMVGVK